MKASVVKGVLRDGKLVPRHGRETSMAARCCRIQQYSPLLVGGKNTLIPYRHSGGLSIEVLRANNTARRILLYLNAVGGMLSVTWELPLMHSIVSCRASIDVIETSILP
jgi:hypothetical protein